MNNTSGSEDRFIREAEDIYLTVDALLEIIERLDSELTDAKDQIESLQEELDAERRKAD